MTVAFFSFFAKKMSALCRLFFILATSYTQQNTSHHAYSSSRQHRFRQNDPHGTPGQAFPYLDSFYEDMQRWSFNIQIFFLNSRFRQVMDIRKSGEDVIQDRTIYEDAHIFAANLYSMGLMETRDFENYQSLFELMTKFLQPPDLLIYLRASVPTLIRHIAKRNREFEQSISISYLTNLNERYEKWISGYNEGKLLIIDTDNIELENPEDLSTVVDRIEASLNGLF